MTRAPGPHDHILYIYKTIDWGKKDTMLVIVIHRGILMKKRHHPKVFQELAFNKKINMN